MIKKMHFLLPREGTDDSHNQFKSSLDYKDEKSIDVGLTESLGNFNPNEFEKAVLNPDEFEGVKELGYFENFPIFDYYPRE